MAFTWFYYKAFVSRNANMLCVVVVTNKWCYLNCTVLLDLMRLIISLEIFKQKTRET